MRLDGRKSMMLSDTKRITPSANLMEPRWRQTFQEALKKLGGEALDPFKRVEIQTSEVARDAASAEADLNRAKLGLPPEKAQTSTSFDSRPEARAFVNQVGASTARAGGSTPTGREVVPTPDLGKAITWGTIAGHGGNALALGLANSPHWALKTVGALANYAVPPVAAVAAPILGSDIADFDVRSQAPEVQAGAATARAEANRLRGNGGHDSALGELYAKKPDALAAYREKAPGLSDADTNALIGSEMGVSMALARGAGPTGPLIAALLGGSMPRFAASQQQAEVEKANKEIAAKNVARVARGEKEQALLKVPEGASWTDSIQYGSTPLLAWGAAKAAPNFLRAAPLAMGAANAVASVAQIVRASNNPEIVDTIRRHEGVDQTSAAAKPFKFLYRTAMGDPIGAMTVADPGGEVSEANRREAMLARRFTMPSADGKMVIPVDLDKIHQMTGLAMQVAPSVPNTAMAQLIKPALRTEDALRYMAKRDKTKLTAEDAGLYARDIVNELSRTWNVPLTNTALYEVTRLVQTIGPAATVSALVPLPDHSDSQDELRAYAVLENKAWIPPAVYAQRAALYNKAFPKQEPAPSTSGPARPGATAPKWHDYGMPLGIGAATLGTLALLNSEDKKKKKKEQEDQE